MKILFAALILTLTFSLSAQTVNDSLVTIPDTLSAVQDSVLTDSLSVLTDSLAAPVPDTLRPIHYTGYTSGAASYINRYKEDLNWYDYRGFEEIVNYLPGGFFVNPGNTGHTGEVYLNGLGYGDITTAIDGNSTNNRMQESYNFYNYDYDNINNVEITGLAKGFLYNAPGNPLFMNFVNYDSIRTIPYTRVRYFQGTEDEGLVNGYFSRVITGKLSGGFSFTNVKSGQRFANTDAGGWNVSGHLKYIFNNNLNMFFDYYYYDTYSELNGGVDYDAITRTYTPSEYEEVLYNGRAAPVIFPYQAISLRYIKYQGEKYHFRTIARFWGHFYSQIDLEYSGNKIEFRQNERNFSSEFARIVNNNNDYGFTASFRQKFTTDIVKFDLLASYSNEDIQSDAYPNVVSDNYFLSANGTLEPFSFISLDLFAKTGRYRTYNVNGSGFEATISPAENLKLSGSTSYSEQAQPYFVSVMTGEEKPVRNIISQIALKYESDYYKLNWSVYSVNKENNYLPYTNGYTDSTDFQRVSGYKSTDYLKLGAAANTTINLAFIELFANPAYNYTEYNSENKFLPQFTFTGGLYYRNIHFNNNLHIKTGFNFRFNTGSLYSVYDYEKSERIYHSLDNSGNLELINNEVLDNSMQLDFVLIGELQQAAIIYFVVENMLDNNNYVLPYYPMWPMGIRIGFNWKLLN